MRSANNTPVLIEETYLPAARFPGLLDADLTGSVYALMADEFDTPPLYSADEHIEAVLAGDSSAQLLGVAVGDPPAAGDANGVRRQRRSGGILLRLLPLGPHAHPGEIRRRPRARRRSGDIAGVLTHDPFFVGPPLR